MAQPGERAATADDGHGVGLWPLIRYAGEDDVVSPSGRWDRTLEDFEVLVNVGDAFTLALGDMKQCVCCGDACVLRPGQAHALIFEPGRHVRLLFCHHEWVGSGAAPVAVDGPHPWGWPPYIPGGTHSPRLVCCLQEVLTVLWARRGPWRWEASVALLGAAAVIERVCATVAPDPAPVPGEPSAVRAARTYIERNLVQGARALVREAARAGGLSVAQINRLFHATYQRSPQEWIRERRVARACFALVHRRADVAAAAQAAGFRDVRYFSHFFQRCTGLTPTAYRARHVGHWRLPECEDLRTVVDAAPRLYPRNAHIQGW